MIDLLVVGGGPSGIATALPAASAGLRVTVLERRVGGHEWRRALEQLAAIRVTTSLDRTTDLYLDYLGRFGELQSLAGSEADADVAQA